MFSFNFLALYCVIMALIFSKIKNTNICLILRLKYDISNREIKQICKLFYLVEFKSYLNSIELGF